MRAMFAMLTMLHRTGVLPATGRTQRNSSRDGSCAVRSERVGGDRKLCFRNVARRGSDRASGR
jgi:hypothetical protein